MAILLIVILLFNYQDVPFKNGDDFLIEVDYQLKGRQSEPNTLLFTEGESGHVTRNLGSSALPFLTVKLTIKNQAEDEVRIRTTNNSGAALFTKKIEIDKVYRIEFGFTDDVKDNITSNAYTVTFLNDKKKAVSKIHLLINNDGTFYVNDVIKGKF